MSNYSRGIDLWHKETKEKNEKEKEKPKNNNLNRQYDHEEGSTEEERSLNNNTNNSSSDLKEIEKKKGIVKKDEITDINDLNPIFKDQIILELGKDNTIVNVDKLIFLLISYLLLMIITLAKGSEHVKSIIGIERY